MQPQRRMHKKKGAMQKKKQRPGTEKARRASTAPHANYQRASQLPAQRAHPQRHAKSSKPSKTEESNPRPQDSRTNAIATRVERRCYIETTPRHI